MSLRDRILSSNDIQKNIIHVEAWGVDVEVRTLTAVERSRFISMSSRADGTLDMEKMYPMLLIAAVFDPVDGSKVFQAEDADMIQEKSAGAVEFVAQEIMKMSGMMPKVVDDEGKSN